MPFDADVLRKRADEIRANLFVEEGDTIKANHRTLEGAKQSSLTLLQRIYGDNSQQVTRFVKDSVPASGEARGFSDPRYLGRVARLIDNVLDSAIADLDAGLVDSIVSQAKGEVLGDFAGLARAALDLRSTGGNAVASVLAAAALEDMLKQLGETNAVDVRGRDIRGVIQKLKDAKVLTGPQASVVEGFVNFRNHALHGEFDKIERESTLSVLAFVESVLTSTFA